MAKKPTYEELEQRIQELEKERIEHKKMDDMLNDNEIKFQDLANSIDDIFFALDNDLNYTFWNKACSHLFGISPENMVGKSFFDFEFNKGFNWIADIYKEVISHRQSRNFESSFDLGKKKVWYDIKAYPTFSGCSVLIKDITERKQAEKSLQKAHNELDKKVEERTSELSKSNKMLTKEIKKRKKHEKALRISEERFRALTENTNDLTVIFDTKKIIRYINPAIKNTFDYSTEEVTGKSILDFIHPDNVQMVNKMIDQAITNVGKSITLDDFCAQHKNGSWKYISGDIIHMPDVSSVNGIVGNFKDVTIRNQMEEMVRENEKKYRLLFETVIHGIQEIDISGKIISANSACHMMLGYKKGELKGRSMFEFIAISNQRKALHDNIQMLIQQQPKPKPWFGKIKKKNGDVFDGQTDWNYKLNIHGEVISFIFVISDITERKNTEKLLKESEESYRRLVEQTQDEYFIYSHDTNGTFQYVSPSVQSVLGYKPDDFLVHFSTYLTDNPINHEAERMTALSIKGERQTPYELEILHKNGDAHILEIAEHPTFDSAGQVISVEGLAHDITERKEAEEKILKLAMTDPLTGLANRTQFHQRLIQSMKLAKRESKSLALMMVDLDKFKPVNDTFGHPAGDSLLQVVASIFAKFTRETDIVARLGGDEFAILFVHPENKENAKTSAQRIIDEIKKPITIMGNEILIGTSIGVALYPEDDDDMEGLIKKADLALYKAKESGRGIFTLYSPEMDS